MSLVKYYVLRQTYSDGDSGPDDEEVWPADQFLHAFDVAQHSAAQGYVTTLWRTEAPTQEAWDRGETIGAIVLDTRKGTK